MSTLEKKKLDTIHRVANNLHIDPIRPGSYLYTLVDGLYTVGQEVHNEVYADILNTKIDTADLYSLERFGALLGVPRLTNKYIIFDKYKEDLQLSVEYFGESTGLPITLYKKGETIHLENRELFLVEDLVYNPSYPYNYISGFVKPSNSILHNGSLLEDTILELPIPSHLANEVKSIYITVKHSKFFNKEEEDISDYRKRLLSILSNRNISGSSVIDKVIKNTPSVYSYYIDKDVTPQKIYAMSYNMYLDIEEREDFEDNVVPNILASIQDVKPYNSVFQVKAAKPLQLEINIETNSDKVTENIISQFIDLCVYSHKLGEPFRLDKRYLESVLLMNGIQDLEYNFKVMINYLGYVQLSPDVDSVLLDRHEYPRILAVNKVPLEEVL